MLLLCREVWVVNFFLSSTMAQDFVSMFMSKYVGDQKLLPLQLNSGVIFRRLYIVACVIIMRYLVAGALQQQLSASSEWRI